MRFFDDLSPEMFLGAGSSLADFRGNLQRRDFIAFASRAHHESCGELDRGCLPTGRSAQSLPLVRLWTK